MSTPAPKTRHHRVDEARNAFNVAATELVHAVHAGVPYVREWERMWSAMEEVVRMTYNLDTAYNLPPDDTAREGCWYCGGHGGGFRRNEGGTTLYHADFGFCIRELSRRAPKPQEPK